jgi:PAS domain S-box-containing protein
VVRWFGAMTDISEQRRTEEALRKAHGELQAVMDAMPISLLISRDPECRIILGNPRAYQVLHEPPGRNLAATAVEDEQPPAFRLMENGTEIPRREQPLEKAAASGQSIYNREVELVLSDGSRANIIGNAVPLLDSEGRPTGAVGIFWDITERKRNEERLRESEERLRMAQQVARLGTFEWDLQTGVDRWTPELEALYGLPPGGFAGTVEAWEELVHPADRAEAVRRVQGALRTGITSDAEYRVIQPDGSVRWLFGRARMFKDDFGKPKRLIGVNMDITEHKMAEESVRESEARLQFVLDAAKLGAWERDMVNHRVVWRAGHYDALFGYQVPLPEWSWETFLEHVVPEDREELDRKFREFLATGTGHRWQHEFRIRRADGAVRWMWTEGRVRRDEDGRAVHMFGVKQDITERKLAEEHLRYAQKMESVGRLAGGVAHDFNNLLTVIMGNADCALTEYPDSEHIQQILTGSQRAAYLTRQLLAYAGKSLFFEKKTLNLGDVVSRSMQLLSDSVPKEVTLTFNKPADKLLIEADPTQIEQIVVNLVTNAGESIPPGSAGRIEVSASLCDVTLEMIAERERGWDVKPGRFVYLDVVDNGSGMDEPTLAKAFDPFFTTKFTGRGLGLAEVYGIVRSYRGFIDVQSSPGAGAAFRVFLPAAGETASMDLPIGTCLGVSSGEDRTRGSSG